MASKAPQRSASVEHLGLRLGLHHASSCEDDRPLGGRDHLRNGASRFGIGRAGGIARNEGRGRHILRDVVDAHALQIVGHADNHRAALVLRDAEGLAHPIKRVVDALDLDVFDAASANQRRLIDLLDRPCGRGGRFTGVDDERNVSPRCGRERGHDLGDARSVGDGRHPDAPGDMGVCARHLTGTMLVAGMNGAHAMPLGQHRRPVHVAVAEQCEMRIHAFRRKGSGKHIVKALLGHSDVVSSPASLSPANR